MRPYLYRYYKATQYPYYVSHCYTDHFSNQPYYPSNNHIIWKYTFRIDQACLLHYNKTYLPLFGSKYPDSNTINHLIYIGNDNYHTL